MAQGNERKAFVQRLGILWKWLVEPTVPIEEPGHYRLARLLSAWLVIFIPLAILISVVTSLALFPGPLLLNPVVVLVLGASVMFIAAYVLSRKGHYVPAAMLTVGVTAISIFGATSVGLCGANPSYRADDPSLLVYLVVPVLFGSVLLPSSVLVVFVAASVAGMLFMPLIFPQVSFPEVIFGPLGFVLMVSALIMLSTQFQRRVEAARRAELAEQKERFRGLFDGVPVALYRTTPEGKILDANPAMVDMLGYPNRKSLMDVNASDLYEMPEQRVQWQALLAREGISRGFERRHLRYDGTAIWCRDTARVVRDGDEKILYYEGCLVDITERKRAEKEREHLLAAERIARARAEAMRKASLVLSSTLDVNQVLEQLLIQIGRIVPYDRANVMWLEGDVARVTHWRSNEKSDGDQLVATLRLPVAQTPNLAQMFDTQRPHIVPDTRLDPYWVHIELPHKVRSWAGAPIIVQEQVVAFFSVYSSVAGYYNSEHAAFLAAFAAHAGMAIENAQLYEDLQKRMEELKHTQAQLIQSAKMAAVGELAAGVAHELGTPLTAVLGFAETLVRHAGPDDPLQKELKIIVSEASRARTIVRNLLSFSRQTEFQRQKADVNCAVQETLALVRQQLKSRGLIIEELYAAHLPLLWMDARRMKQVFLNLVTNASQAMARGGTLTVRSEHVGDHVVVYVIDTGTGIQPEHLERIFEPFFTTTPEGQGTGLGLSVSLGIVQDHGGHIEVESRVGQGSTFAVWLPVQKEEMD
jgi:PAS domain S-box-containing protein